MPALSHFSYDFTEGKYLLCDLQGERRADGTYILTDPVIMSTKGDLTERLRTRRPRWPRAHPNAQTAAPDAAGYTAGSSSC